ncbi:hypothetical protein GALMADRAFT_243122 [Galerina marginata CBS 339.88]|uniref:Phospholipid/glycerol acyltransferase domain-containing protein n=1 Tax=Galerina marginata (strain CBS 339.88) TaxID=685588 RepID=A0A067TJR4_GALM3|nr:hypothetical protein GALMADRAFT_243122 [Galerina marginata CBS 339.88]
MELKLVYRALRKISDWTVTGYYSESYVDGQANVPKNGPLIIAATHHNEIIDIATLAATIPYRRHLSFWASSKLFANPLAGAILSSSGAIPVKRNPNTGSGAARPNTDSSASTTTLNPNLNASASTELTAHSDMYLATSKALAANQVVGVFPEGASYTHAKILQVMPGTAWAAVEYVRYVHEAGVGGELNGHRSGNGKGKGKERASEVETGLRIVPVAIVYTDKARYRSRIYVKYGEPILLDSYANELSEGNPGAVEASKGVVKKIMAQVQKQLSDMSVNAPDWDTICAVSMARSILWGDENNIPLKDWVEVSQRLVQIIAPTSQDTDDPTPGGSSAHLKGALTKYYALLHYTSMKHSILLSLLPMSSSSVLDIPPPHSLPSGTMLVQPTLSILSSLPLALIRFALFLPPFLLYFPGYISGSLLAKACTKPGEEESLAQFKAVGGGLGIGANIALALGVLWKQNKLGTLSALLGLGPDSGTSGLNLKRVFGLVGTVYCSVLVLVKWHNLLVNANYRQLQTLLTYFKLFSTFAFRRTADTDKLSPAELGAYCKPPLPAANHFIRRKDAPLARSTSSGESHDLGCATDTLSESEDSEEVRRLQQPKSIASRKLVRHVLHARVAACAALSAHLSATEGGPEDRMHAAFLKSRGAKLPAAE